MEISIFDFNVFQVLRQIAVQCLCQLLITHPHFNYRTNIISVIIPFMLHHDSKVQQILFYISRIDFFFQFLIKFDNAISGF